MSIELIHGKYKGEFSKKKHINNFNSFVKYENRINKFRKLHRINEIYFNELHKSI